MVEILSQIGIQMRSIGFRQWDNIDVLREHGQLVCASHEALRDENTELKAEIARLNARLAAAGKGDS